MTITQIFLIVVVLASTFYASMVLTEDINKANGSKRKKMVYCALVNLSFGFCLFFALKAIVLTNF